MSTETDNILQRYGDLLVQVDRWFTSCLDTYPDQIRCGQGCSGCCRGLFDITLLDAWYLQLGFCMLPQATQAAIRDEAAQRLASMRQYWPEFAEPYLLNYRPEADWDMLMPDEDETPCVFLDDAGRCLVYDHRPMTCRLHGIPLVDSSGEVLHEEWCTENFLGIDPLLQLQLRGQFNAVFRDEVMLMQVLTDALFKQYMSELDTLIPLAVLVEYDRFDWRDWQTRVRLVMNEPIL